MYDENRFKFKAGKTEGRQTLSEALSAVSEEKTPDERSREISQQRQAEDDKILALHKDAHGIPYTPNSGMHFAMHFGEHPKFGKLYIGNGSVITNDPKRAKKTSPMDSSGLWRSAGRTGMSPFQPKFHINGVLMTRDHVLHPELKEYVRSEKLRAEPRLTFSREVTQNFANKWHADQAEAKIRNQREPFKLVGGKKRAKLREIEKEEREGELEEGWSAKYKKGRKKGFKSFSEEMNLRESIRNMAITAIAAAAPAHAEHTVQKGDTLSAMARKHNISVADLAKHNEIADPNKITIGQVIKFPGKKKEEPKVETPTKKTPAPETPKTPDNCPYGELCGALQRAETGSEKDPFIRTRHRPKRGSTAYGPGQITGQTLRDFNTRYPQEFSGVKDYMKTLIDQSKQFAKYGAEPKKAGYEARFDYGGSGDPAAKDSERYNIVQRGVLRGMANDIFGEIPSELSKDQRERLVTRYRGATRQQDPRYFREVDRTYAQ